MLHRILLYSYSLLMNEKKAIVFFFFCFVFFSFFFYFLVVVPSTYVTRIRLSLAVFVLFVSVCSSSPSCARSPASVLLARPMCVCVFQFPLFAVVVVVFFSGASHSVSNAAAALLARTWFLLFCFNVVIRGGVFLHFFSEQNTHARAHVHGHGNTHTQTDGWRKVRARR